MLEKISMLSMIGMAQLHHLEAAENCFDEPDPLCKHIDCLKEFNVAITNCKLTCNFCRVENENMFSLDFVEPS